MKAVVQSGYGGPEVLAVRDVGGPPVAGKGEVLIRVRAAGLNPADYFLMRGLPRVVRLFSGLRAPRDRVRGIEVAGTVAAVGAGITGLHPGDDVFGWCGRRYHGGGLAEYACVPGQLVTAKPAVITFEQAAALPVAGVTALQALRDRARLRPGQKILVNGASGGVGTFAVQIAKVLGASVTGVCSTRNTDLVRKIGADEVIDYTQQDFTRGAGRRYEVILDNVGNHPLPGLRHMLTRDGTLIPNAGDLGRLVRTLATVLVRVPFTRQRIRMFLARQDVGDLRVLARYAEEGKITPVIDRTYPLGEAAQAIGYLEQRHARGKVIISTGHVADRPES